MYSAKEGYSAWIFSSLVSSKLLSGTTVAVFIKKTMAKENPTSANSEGPQDILKKNSPPLRGAASGTPVSADMSAPEAADLFAAVSADMSAPEATDLFAADAHKQLQQPQEFAGENDDFYNQLLTSLQPNTFRTSVLQKSLILGIILIVAALLYVFLKPVPKGHGESSPQPIAHITPKPAVTPPTPKTQPSKSVENTISQLQQAPAQPQQAQRQESEPQPTQPLSLQVAGDLYLQKDYQQAMAAYNQLCHNISINPEEELLRDFLRLRAAFCAYKLNDFEQADILFRNVSQSRSPVVNIIANYQLCLLEMQRKQYLKAWTKACQTIALIDAVTFDREWTLSLQKTCNFLVAESITRSVLSLYDADKDIPEQLWKNADLPEPFNNINETELRAFLNSGSEQMDKSALSPQIENLEQQGAISRWSVSCAGASIEELLARFTANAGLDLRWISSGETSSKETRDLAKQKSVYLYMSGVTSQQFVATAAGCAGLLAHIENQQMVNVLDPTNTTPLSEQKTLLSQEAISLWQKYLLVFHGDERSANAHYALGLLQDVNGQTADAAGEFKFVANRFSQSPLASFALLNSSRIKTNLRDYTGACQDLSDLVQQYPDTSFAGQAHLYLADATFKTQLYDEAQRIYMKVYNLGFSQELQAAAAYGTAKCLYEKKDYQSAEQWLNKYLRMAKDKKSQEVYEAYFLLGKADTALGKPQQACEVFEYTLAAEHSPQEYADIASNLAGVYIEQERFVEALELLAGIPSWQLSQQDAVNVLLLQSKVVRAMGLIDNAITMLDDRAEYISDAQLKAKISFELADCYISKGNLELALKSLTEVLVLAESGHLVNQARLASADVYLKLGQSPQTIPICSQLLESDAAPEIKQKAKELMASAYTQEKDYNRAALVLLGKWNGIPAKQE